MTFKTEARYATVGSPFRQAKLTGPSSYSIVSGLLPDPTEFTGIYTMPIYLSSLPLEDYRLPLFQSNYLKMIHNLLTFFSQPFFLPFRISCQYSDDLVVKLLYGCGLRLFECLRLRVQCMNFDVG